MARREKKIVVGVIPLHSEAGETIGLATIATSEELKGLARRVDRVLKEDPEVTIVKRRRTIFQYNGEIPIEYVDYAIAPSFQATDGTRAMVDAHLELLGLGAETGIHSIGLSNKHAPVEQHLMLLSRRTNPEQVINVFMFRTLSGAKRGAKEVFVSPLI